MRHRLNVTALALLYLLVGVGGSDAQDKPVLRIVVIAGEDAVNVISQQTAVAPVIEIRDRNNLPVAGVPVTFSIASGNAMFAGAQTVTVTTDAAGRATASALTPVSNGAVRIQVTAVSQGQTASVTISQSNVMSPPSANGNAGGSGGGLSGLAIGGMIAGVGGAVAIVAGTKQGDSPTGTTPTAPPTANRPPSVATPTTSCTATIPGVPVTFSASATDAEGDPLTYSWDFGDGSTSAETTPSHIYQRAGVFMVRVSVRDRESTTTAETPMTVKTLSGTWLVTAPVVPGIETIYTLNQNGTTVTGSWSNHPSRNCPGVSGVISASSPNLVLTIPSCPSQSGGTARMELGSDADFLDQGSGTFSLRRR